MPRKRKAHSPTLPLLGRLSDFLDSHNDRDNQRTSLRSYSGTLFFSPFYFLFFVFFLLFSFHPPRLPRNACSMVIRLGKQQLSTPPHTFPRLPGAARTFPSPVSFRARPLPDSSPQGPRPEEQRRRFSAYRQRQNCCGRAGRLLCSCPRPQGVLYHAAQGPLQSEVLGLP